MQRVCRTPASPLGHLRKGETGRRRARSAASGPLCLLPSQRAPTGRTGMWFRRTGQALWPPDRVPRSSPTACRARRCFRSVKRGCQSGRGKRDPHFPRPCATVPRRPVGPGTTKGQRPPGAGRALAGGFGHRLVLMPAQHCGRGDGPCQRYQASARAPVRAGSANTTRVSPAGSGRCPANRQAWERQRSAPRPAGAKRPAGAERARGTRMAGALAPTGMRRARRRKSFPLSLSAAPAAGTFWNPAKARCAHSVSYPAALKKL